MLGSGPARAARNAYPLRFSLLLPGVDGISSVLPKAFGGSYLAASLAESSRTCCGVEKRWSEAFSKKSLQRLGEE